MAGFLSRTRSVGTGYELCAHGTPGKSSIITFVHFGVERERAPVCFHLFCFFILSPNLSCKSF